MTQLQYFAECPQVIDRHVAGQRIICVTCSIIVGTYPLGHELECRCGTGYREMRGAWPEGWHTVNNHGMGVIPA